MMKSTYLKMAGSVLIVLVLLSIVSLPASLVLADKEHGERHEHCTYCREVNITVRFNLTLPFDEALSLAYIVRNVSYPMFEWSLAQNITLAEVLLSRGDYFLEKAINVSSINETRATILALVAATLYSRAPITAYPVLGRTIRDSLGENNTLTNETVLAVIEKAEEIKSLVDEAKNIAEQYNVTPLKIVDFLVADATGKINTSLLLLEEGYLGRALSYAVRAYHEYTRAYSWIIKSVFIEKLNLGAVARITDRILVRRFNEKIMEKIIEHMPEWVKARIMEKIRKGIIRDIKDLRKHIRLVVELYKERLENITINYIAKTLTSVIILGSRLPGPQGQAIREWMRNNGLINKRMLIEHIHSIVVKVHNETNATSIELLRLVLIELEREIEQDTGININLNIILHMIITARVIHRGNHH